ncbi:hypothetical protein [Sporisorium scitamineum]|uniref:Uncharacterized protein n=1 Tax=Sporisorium scitamineum TaxID=49012 RepID=A0A0F7S4K4_9BASI|nr:hypothetical protein [Sporisorium scitamineum]
MSLSDWVPEGLLPRWLLVVAAMAHLNGANNFIKPSFSAKVYSTAGTQSDHPFVRATLWCLELYLCHHSRLCRLQHPRQGTAKLGPGMISPLIVASSSLTAMYLQHGTYVN